jgi:hypothetical protein
MNIIIFIIIFLLFYLINFFFKKKIYKDNFINFSTINLSKSLRIDKELFSGERRWYENLKQHNINKICCFYAYYEKNKLYKDNFKYFLDNAILTNIDYYIIINGEYTIDIPNKDNIKVFRRENKGFDFGAYSYIVNLLGKKFLNKYSYYCFLNATVKGPYLKNKKDWLNEFLKLFINNVRIVGTSICYTTEEEVLKKYNIKNIYYVQSMFFIINNNFFNILNEHNFFDDEQKLNNEKKLRNIVINKEIKLSYLSYLSNGNINCYLKKYRNLDFKKLNYDINPSSFRGDPYFPNKYFNSSIKPEDVIFYKNKRFMIDVI